MTSIITEILKCLLRGAIVLGVSFLITLLLSSFAIVKVIAGYLVIAVFAVFACLIIGVVTEEPANDLCEWLKGKF